MRNLKMLLVVLFVSIMLSSCEKQDDNDLKTQNIFHAKKDGESWEATKTWGRLYKINTKLVFAGANEDTDYCPSDELKIIIEQETILVNEKIRDFEATLSCIFGGDQVFWTYDKTKTLDESYVLITELDTINNRVSGEFEIILKEVLGNDVYFSSMTEGEFALDYDAIEF